MLVAKIKDWDGKILTAEAPFDDIYTWTKYKPQECELYIMDSRCISSQQRKKCYALFRDISHWSGHLPEEVKELMKYDYIAKTGAKEFSLSDTDKTNARHFITHLIEFCLMWDIPCRDSLLNTTDDVSKYLYLCLYHKKCCVCGKRADTHHVDRVGIGRNRKEICHVGMRAQALCRKHHNECHNIGQKEFDSKYYTYGIKIDEVLAKRLKLGKSERRYINGS